MCNREIKFGVFRAWAKDHGFAAVATGHYARREEVPDNGNRIPERAEVTNGPSSTAGRQNSATDTPAPRISGYPVSGIRDPVSPSYRLLEGTDKNKDQSYFLALLSQEQLRDALFPIGDLAKPELRRLARAAGLPTADKKDSQGICFIGEVKMADFLRTYVPDAPGPIVRATDGVELGQHRGLHFYTLGQRKGIGIPSNTDHEAYVVVGKRVADRALLVAFDQPQAPGLFQTEVRVHSLSWTGDPVTTESELEARVRYRDPRVPIEFVPEGGGTASVRFHSPQRGLASGQILALYDGERLLGGGVYV
jgi:tRNA-specific 2-thiouridylase